MKVSEMLELLDQLHCKLGNVEVKYQKHDIEIIYEQDETDKTIIVME